MSNKLRKIAASVMAVVTLTTGAMGISASAESGSRRFTIANYTATANISRTTTFGYASTSCYGANITYLYAQVTARGTHAAITNMDTIYGPGIVSATAYVDGCHKAESYHVARTSSASNSISLVAY